MKNFILTVILLFTSISFFGMKLGSHQEYIQDSIKITEYETFQKITKVLIKKKLYNNKRDSVFLSEFLNTKEKAIIYAKNFILMECPKCSILDFENIEVMEDPKKELWYIYYKFPTKQVPLGGNIKMIIVKNSCKVVFFSSHS